MEKRVIGIVFLILLSRNLLGQSDHLRPVQSFANLKDYYDGLFSVLNKGLQEKPIARFTVLPSFTPEYVLSVEKDSFGQCKLRLHVLSDNYWYAPQKTALKVVERELLIPVNLANQIKTLFESVTNQIKEPTVDGRGFDGTTFYFSTPTNRDGTMITGEIWSPSEGTRMEKLVSICNDLVRAVKDSKSKSNLAKLELRIQEFLKS